MTDLQVEQAINSLRRDYRNLQRAVTAADPDSYVTAMLLKLGRTVTETQRLLQELHKETKK